MWDGEGSVEVYINRDQLLTLGKLAMDSLAGVQLETDTRDDSTVYVKWLDYDGKMQDGKIMQDGTFIDLT